MAVDKYAGRIRIGDKVRDVVTGFEGIAMGYTDWITGCRQYGVQPGKILDTGKLSEISWFDENRLEIVAEGAVKLPTSSNTVLPDATGGPLQSY